MEGKKKPENKDSAFLVDCITAKLLSFEPLAKLHFLSFPQRF
jgi:hypothetical protein